MVNLSLAFKNLTRHSVNTILSVTGIGLVFATFILLSNLSKSVVSLAGMGDREATAALPATLAVIVAFAIVFFVTRSNLSKRVKETALLRIVGWGRFKVLSLILAEGLWLGLLGGLAGIIIGSLAIFTIPSFQFTPVSITFDLDLNTYSQALLLSVASGIAGAFFPASKVSKISPTKVLNHE